MAALVRRDTTAATTTNATNYTSASFTPTAGDLLVVLIRCTGTVGSAPVLTASANGITFGTSGSPFINQFTNASAHKIMVFIANQLVGASPSAMTVTVTLTSGDTASGCSMGVIAATGMTQVGTAAVLQFKADDNSRTASGSTPTVVLPAVPQSTNPVLGWVGNISSANVVQPSGWTELFDMTFATPTTGFEAVALNSGASSATITWGSTTTIGAEGAIEFDASAGGSTVTGTLSGTLPVVTGSASGSSTNPGTLSANLPVVTANASGTETNSGSESSSLPVVTGSIAGTSVNPGTTSGTLPVVTGSATGTSTNPGTSSGSLPKVIASIADTSSVTGTLAASLPKVTGSATGTQVNSGTVAAALPVVTGSTSGTSTNSATLTANLPPVTGSVTGSSVTAGTLTANLPKVVGVIADSPIVLGSLVATLPPVTGSITGTVSILGTVAGTLPRVTGAVTGTLVESGIHIDATATIDPPQFAPTVDPPQFQATPTGPAFVVSADPPQFVSHP